MGERQREDKCDDGVDNVAVDVVDDSTDSDDDDDLTTDGNVTAVAAVRSVESSNFGNIAVKNSSDVHFGNKTFYQGPVTIRQIVYAANKDSTDLSPAEEELKDVISQTLAQSQKTNGFVRTTQDERIYKEDPGSQPTNCCLRRRHVIWISAAGVAVVVVATLLMFLSGTNNPVGPKDPAIQTDTHPAYAPPRPTGKVRLVSRIDWSAQPPADVITDLRPPVPYVIISHTAGYNCSTQADCVRLVRNIQTLHIESNGWSDIAYNFLVGGDGSAYMGRGWDKAGAHSHVFNNCSIGISFIGTFTKERAPHRQLDAALLLIEEGVDLGKIRSDYRLIGHNQVSPTKSPGEALFADLTKLKHHFNETVLKCSEVIHDMDQVLMQKQSNAMNSTSVN